MSDNDAVPEDSGAELLRRARASGDPAVLAAAIEALRGRAGRGARENLATALMTRFEWTGDVQELHAAIGLYRELMRDAEPEAGLLTNLGLALRLRGEVTDSAADLDEAVDVSRRAVRLLPGDDPERVGLWSNLAAALVVRYTRRRTAADLDEAIDAGRRAVGGMRGDDPDRLGYLANLATALYRRFGAAHDAADLDEAVIHARAAVAAGDGHPMLPTAIMTLANALQVRGEPEDLDEAVSLQRAANGIAGPGERASALAGLATTLRSRYAHTGALSDLDSAVAYGRAAIAAAPAGTGIDAANRLTALGNALATRSAATGDARELDEAVTLARRAVDLVAPETAEYGAYLSNLAGKLRGRYERRRAPADLDEAIALGRRAVAHERRPGHLGNLAALLSLRFFATRRRADLDEAVAFGRAAVAAAPRDAGCRDTLAITLLTRLAHGGPPSDLDDALDALQDTDPPAAGARTAPRTRLCDALLLRYQRDGSAEDLARAVEAGRAGVAGTPQGHPARAAALISLARVCIVRYLREPGRHPGDLGWGVELLRQAAHEPTAPVGDRIQAARQWAGIAATAGVWPSAAAGYATAARLLPLLAWRGIGRAGGERLLGLFAGLAGDAAAGAIAAGDPAGAVVAGDQARSVLWAQLAETRPDLRALRAADPELAARLDAAAARVEAAAYRAGFSSPGPT
ncbi:tetratricopeptide repeat protein [Dactylosporangium sp. CA-139066]|uniref:tetratricopeptide repeat protein n=1 Tax=Dactylosporangium sp. CA-139066 TaxID=3239930 RepID=UPI003D91BCE9